VLHFDINRLITTAAVSDGTGRPNYKEIVKCNLFRNAANFIENAPGAHAAISILLGKNLIFATRKLHLKQLLFL